MFAAAADATTELRMKALLLQWSLLLPFKNCFHFATYLHASLLLKKCFFLLRNYTTEFNVYFFCCCLCNCFCWRQGWTNVTNAFIIFGHQQWLLLSWQKENYNPLFLFHFISIQFHFFFFGFLVVVVLVVFKHTSLCLGFAKNVCVCATVLPF